MKRSLLVCGVLGLVAFAISGWFWGSLPDPMPIHWDFRGKADNFASKGFALFGLPALIFVLPGVIAGLLQIDKRWEKSEGSRRAVYAIVIYLGLFLLALHLITIKAALTKEAKLSLPLLFLVMGLFFAMLGNVMPSLKPNGFAGIRIPATLRDPRVWEKSHRFGGWTMTISGLLTAFAGFVLPIEVAAIAVIVFLFVGAVAPIFYAIRLEKILPPLPPSDAPSDASSKETSA